MWKLICLEHSPPISISDFEFELYSKCHMQLIDCLVIKNEDQ